MSKKNIFPIIIFFGSRSFERTLEKLFPSIQRRNTPTELLRNISQRYPHIIFIEDITPQQSIKVTSAIRNQNPEVDIPILIFSTNTWLPHQKKSLSILNQSYRISSSAPSSKIKDQVEMLLDMNYLDRMNHRCHPHALALLIHSFRNEENGSLSNKSRTIPLRDGGAVTYNAEEELRSFLHEESPTFTRSLESGLGDWILVMDIIWDELKKFTAPGFLTQRKRLALQIKKKQDKLFSLPIKAKTFSFIFETDPNKSIQERLETQSLPQSVIEQDIEMLYRMGFCSFLIIHTPRALKSVAMESITVLNEQEGWSVLEKINKHQNIELESASPHFWRSLLNVQQQKSIVHPTSKVIQLLQSGQIQHAYLTLSETLEQNPSWDSLQLICWLQLLLSKNSAQSKHFKRLIWLHKQKPSSTSALCIATYFSEQLDFTQAKNFIEQAQATSKSPKRYGILKKLLNRELPIPHSVVHNLL